MTAACNYSRPQVGCRWRRVGGWLGSAPTPRFYYMKNTVFAHFLLFLDLLEFEKGSGSKFWLYKYQNDVWNPEINQFRSKLVQKIRTLIS